MKKTFLILLSVCLFSVGQAMAGNVLTVSNVSVPQGGQATIEIGCEFDTEYTAFEVQMDLPDGLTLLSDDDGKPIVERAFDGSHTMTGSLLPSNGNYKFTCYSTDEYDLSMPTDGPLLRVTVVADATLSLGTNLTASITACEFTRTADSQGENLADVDFTITITEFRTILDETSITAPVAEDNANVRVKRTINANEWSTICLPFAMTEAQVKAAFGDDVQLGDFTGYDTAEAGDEVVSITVNFDIVTSIEANHPYIIKVSDKVTEFTVDGVTIDPEDNPCVSFGYNTGKKPVVYHPKDFNGTYVADFDFYNDATSYPLFLSGNKFYYATNNTMHMKAFRAYFDFDDYLSEAAGASSRVTMFTGISEIGNSKSPNGKYYDLQGRSVDSSQLKKGLYIVNGKMVIK